MAKKLTCRHAGVAEQIMGKPVECDWEGTAPSEGEVVAALVEHNRIAHGLESGVPLSTVGDRIRHAIQET